MADEEKKQNISALTEEDVRTMLGAKEIAIYRLSREVEKRDHIIAALKTQLAEANQSKREAKR